MREGSAKKNSYGKNAMGGLTSIWKDRRVTLETSESFGVPDCSIRSGGLDNEKT